MGILHPILLFLMVTGSRLQIRTWHIAHRARIHPRMPRSRVAIYGAGSAGRQMAVALRNSLDMRVVAILDNNIVSKTRAL